MSEFLSECPNDLCPIRPVCALIKNQERSAEELSNLIAQIPDALDQIADNLMPIGNCNWENKGRCIMFNKGSEVSLTVVGSIAGIAILRQNP